MIQSIRALSWRRALFVWPILLLSGVITALGVAVAGAPVTVLEALVLLFFALVMAWQSFIAWQYVVGFVAWALGRRALSSLEVQAEEVPATPSGLSRTAVLLPVYEEDPGKVFAAVRVMARALARTGSCGDVEFHVLSDTRDAAVAAAEEREYEAALRWREGDATLPLIRYRRRDSNAGRKVGNLSEFLDRAGSRFDFMIVLDADSLMSGAAMRKLIRLMEANPRVGLIQTVSYATNRETLFARVQQFAVRLYAPLAIRGLDLWQGHDGSYWGHNAILRVRAFREHCELPVLSGHPPFGGEILCHDTVEAALMRRAGWAVRLLPEMEGTWEEMPTNTIDLLARERRWCQGNLQHLRVLSLPGLALASRAHLALGIAGYVSAPLWAAFLGLAVMGAALGSSESLALLTYGLTASGGAATALFALVLAVLGAPKILSLARALADGPTRRAYGGTGRLLASAALEQVVWTLLWPVLTVFNTASVVGTVIGKVVRWDPQGRDDRSVAWREGARRHLAHAALGAALLAAGASAGGWLLLWTLPIAVALLASPALTAVTSRADWGRASQRMGLFLTLDDTRPAEELKEIRRAAPALAPAPAPEAANASDPLGRAA